MIYSALVQCLLKTVPMLISANHKFLQKFNQDVSNHLSYFFFRKKVPISSAPSKAMAAGSCFQTPAEFASKTGTNSDENNAKTANSKKDKYVSKISVKQFEQQPLSTVNL